MSSLADPGIDLRIGCMFDDRAGPGNPLRMSGVRFCSSVTITEYGPAAHPEKVVWEISVFPGF